MDFFNYGVSQKWEKFFMSDENNRPLNNNDDGMQQPEHHHHHHRHHRRHRGWKIFWSVVGVLVLVALFFAGMAWHNLKSTTDDMIRIDTRTCEYMERA